ncbi:MAG: hypothetical protein IT376_06240 [Polyangiaceae bacterium]|nr:hypothetical protein [Polyangiaceae bacterium]
MAAERLATAFAVALATACSSSPEAPAPAGSSAPGEVLEVGPRTFTFTGTDVRAEDGSRFISRPMTVWAAFASILPNGYDFSLELTAGAETQSWTAKIGLSSADLPEGEGEARIVQTQMAPGIAWVERHRLGAPAIRGAEGLVRYRFHDGRVRFTVSESDPSLNATVEGEYNVACVVPPAELGLQENGVSSDDGVQLVEDTYFESAKCARFRQP